MHSRKGLFWRSLFWTLLTLVPLCAAVLFFASDAAGFIPGQMLGVDGGFAI